jgi:hypothetical protein
MTNSLVAEPKGSTPLAPKSVIGRDYDPVLTKHFPKIHLNIIILSPPLYLKYKLMDYIYIYMGERRGTLNREIRNCEIQMTDFITRRILISRIRAFA